MDLDQSAVPTQTAVLLAHETVVGQPSPPASFLAIIRLRRPCAVTTVVLVPAGEAAFEHALVHDSYGCEASCPNSSSVAGGMLTEVFCTGRSCPPLLRAAQPRTDRPRSSFSSTSASPLQQSRLQQQDGPINFRKSCSTIDPTRRLKG